MATLGAFLVGQRFLPASNTTSVSSATYGASAAYELGQLAVIGGSGAPPENRMMVGDELWMCIVWGLGSTVPTFSLPAGWTQVIAETIDHSPTSKSRIEWWKRTAKVTDTTWSANAPTVTSSISTRWVQMAMSVRGGFVDAPASEALAGGGATITPSQNVSLGGRSSQVVGFAYGTRSSGGAQTGPDFSPSSSSPNADGWYSQGGYETGQPVYGFGFYSVLTSTTPTLPTFNGGSTAGWGWVICAVPYEFNPPNAGWSVGFLKF